MVSVDQPARQSLDLRLVSRAHRRIEPLHAQIYLAPETAEHLVATGLRPGRMVYFAGRAAALGAVGAGVVAATFYNFNPAVIARHIPRAWTLASPERVVEARTAAARASLTRLLGGPDAAAADDVVELAALLREACTALTPEARPLYAAQADLPWPEEPVLQLWHGATLLREHRGDGHLASLLRHELSGIEALATFVLTGRGLAEEVALASRGWSGEEWSAALDRLAVRGLVADGALTEAGQQLRAALELETDALSAAPFEHLGVQRTERVAELGAQLAARLLAAGAYGPGGAATEG